MPPSEKKVESPVATALMSCLQRIFQKANGLPFSKDPDSLERDVIEYDSRMRTFGLERFNGPCFVTSISFYLSQQDMDAHKAQGAIVLFIEESSVGRILKAMGEAKFNEDDDEVVFEKCAEFCNVIAMDFQQEISSLGYKNLVVGKPNAQRNDIAEGVEFPYDQYKFSELNFYFFKRKAVVVDVVMAPK